MKRATIPNIYTSKGMQVSYRSALWQSYNFAALTLQIQICQSIACGVCLCCTYNIIAYAMTVAVHMGMLNQFQSVLNWHVHQSHFGTNQIRPNSHHDVSWNRFGYSSKVKNIAFAAAWTGAETKALFTFWVVTIKVLYITAHLGTHTANRWRMCPFSPDIAVDSPLPSY